MGKLWDVVWSIVQKEEEAIIKYLQEAKEEAKKKVEEVKEAIGEKTFTVDLTDQYLDDYYELELKGFGYIPVILLKTNKKSYTITWIPDKNNTNFRKTFDSLAAISEGNPLIDAIDRTSTEGYYYLAIRNIRFTERFYLRIQFSERTHIINLYIIYYLIGKVKVSKFE